MQPDLEVGQSMDSYQCWLVVSGLNTAFVRNVARMTLGEGEEPGLSEGIGPLPGRPFTLADIDSSRGSSVRPAFVLLYRFTFLLFWSYLSNLSFSPILFFDFTLLLIILSLVLFLFCFLHFLSIPLFPFLLSIFLLALTFFYNLHFHFRGKIKSRLQIKYVIKKKVLLSNKTFNRTARINFQLKE